MSRGDERKPEPRLREKECEGWWRDPGGRKPSGCKTDVIFIAVVIDGKVNVMLWQRAAIISVSRLTAATWIEGKAERRLCGGNHSGAAYFKTGLGMWIFAGSRLDNHRGS